MLHRRSSDLFHHTERPFGGDRVASWLTPYRPLARRAAVPAERHITGRRGRRTGHALLDQYDAGTAQSQVRVIFIEPYNVGGAFDLMDTVSDWSFCASTATWTTAATRVALARL